MKTFVKYVPFLIIVIVSMASSCDKHGEPLFIRNNSNQVIYYWYAHWLYDQNYTNYHYPDTILPSEERIYSIWAVHPNRVVEISGVSKLPNWEKIFSDLPEGKFSVYFFTVARRLKPKKSPAISRTFQNKNKNNRNYNLSGIANARLFSFYNYQ